MLVNAPLSTAKIASSTQAIGETKYEYNSRRQIVQIFLTPLLPQPPEQQQLPAHANQ